MDIRAMFRQYFDQAIASIKSDRETQIYLALLVVFVIGGGGYYGHHWYTVDRAQKAHQAYITSFLVYQTALVQNQESNWQHVEIDARDVLQRPRGTLYEPFVRAFLAQALVRLGKRDEGIGEMQQAVAHMPIEYRGIYQVNFDLMLLDGTAQDQARAVVDLQALGADGKCRVQDMALYMLGTYYATHGDQRRAMEYFKQVSAIPQPVLEVGSVQSPWQAMARHKLSELGVDER